jgi:hypothetical protein
MRGKRPLTAGVRGGASVQRLRSRRHPRNVTLPWVVVFGLLSFSGHAALVSLPECRPIHHHNNEGFAIPTDTAARGDKVYGPPKYVCKNYPLSPSSGRMVGIVTHDTNVAGR